MLYPVELQAHITEVKVGGATGLEPATPGTTTQCANRLRHAPHNDQAPTPGRIRTSGRRLRRPLLCPLSYGRIFTRAEDGDRTRITGLEGQCSTIELLPHHVSERPDSNRRPQRPERCALTKLRHSPYSMAYSSRGKKRVLPSRTMVNIGLASSSIPETISFQSSTEAIFCRSISRITSSTCNPAQ